MKFVCLIALEVLMSFICVGKTSYAAIITEPFAPLPGQPVKVIVAGTFDDICLSFNRWQQVASRVIVYGDVPFEFDPKPPCTRTFEFTLAAAAAPVLYVEVWARRYDTQPPDGYELVDAKTVLVGATSAGRNPATTIRITSSQAQSVLSSPTPTGFFTAEARDTAGQPVANALVNLDFATHRGFLRSTFRENQPRYTSVDGVAKFGYNEAAFAQFSVGQYVTYKLSLPDTLASNPPAAFATVGTVSPQFAAFAFPVIEYSFSGQFLAVGAEQPGNFLASDTATTQSLDALKSTFFRTFAVFTGLTANAPSAVPVCRFFSDGRAGRPLTHWYTADTAECSAKRADPNWIYEGTPFWTLGARAEGYCPPSTGAVHRLLYLNQSRPSAAPARYVQDIELKNSVLARAVSVSGYRWIDDGVAFCAPL